MPIYAYRCSECGFTQDVLQKIADPVLTVCPSCGKPEFKKQVTAAGFQLKGSGWYATDFKNSSGGASASTPDTQKKEADSANTSTSEATSTSSSTETGNGANTSAASTPTK